MSDENTELMQPQDEYDFSGDGEPERELEFTVTGFERKETEDKNDDTILNIRHEFTLESDDLPFPIRMSEWSKHTNEKAQAIGRGNLRRLALAATKGESAKYDAEGAPIVGSRIKATIYEDNAGFRRVKRPKPVRD